MEYKEELLKIFTEVLSLLQSGVEFGKEQIPQLVQEILTYNLIISSIGVTVGLILLIFSIFTIKYILKIDYLEDPLEYVLHSIIASFISILLMIRFFPELIKIIFAPRLYLIEYLQHLI